MLPVLRLLRRPRWIAAVILGGVLVVLFIDLGLWQLRRHDERRQFNRRVEAALEVPPVPWTELSEPDEFRRVILRGTYMVQTEASLAPRTYQGRAGVHRLTPLRLGDGDLVVVDRGFIPSEGEVTGPAPQGEVEVVGVVRLGREGGRYVQESFTVTRVNLTVLAERMGPVLPWYVELQEQTPPQPDGYPVPPELPDLGEGSHLSYALQWFFFASMVIVGFPILLLQSVRRGQLRPETR